MTKEELAALLTGSEYPFYPDAALMKTARQNGLVVVYGASDDLMEFDGVFREELGANDGTTAYLSRDGLLVNDCANEECPHFDHAKAMAVAKGAFVDALWCAEDGYSWTYRTEIPHATFEVVEDGEPYCRGIVFSLSEVQS